MSLNLRCSVRSVWQVCVCDGNYRNTLGLISEPDAPLWFNWARLCYKYMYIENAANNMCSICVRSFIVLVNKYILLSFTCADAEGVRVCG